MCIDRFNAPKPHMSTRSTVLIADDEPVNLTLLADSLSDLYRVRNAFQQCYDQRVAIAIKHQSDG
jgi:CheY-like chemotaxis protein